jgi:hypothetical protein
VLDLERRHRGKEETIVVDLKEDIVLASHTYRASPKVFHPRFKSIPHKGSVL